MTAFGVAIMLAVVTTHTTTTEPSPQFRPVGQYPIQLPPLLEEHVGELDRCESAPVGAGRFVVRYHGDNADRAGVYLVDITRESVIRLIEGTTQVLRLVQDNADVSWMLMTSMANNQVDTPPRYLALVFRRPKQMLAPEQSNGSPVLQDDSIGMKVSVATLIDEPQNTVIGFEIRDLNDDGYPDIRFDVEDVQTRTKTRLDFIYTNGGFICQQCDG